MLLIDNTVWCNGIIHGGFDAQMFCQLLLSHCSVLQRSHCDQIRHILSKTVIVLDICLLFPKDRPKPYLALAVTLLILCSGLLPWKQIQ